MNFVQYNDICSAAAAALDTNAIDQLLADLEAAYLGGHCVFIIGNGGSGANASHLCEDLGKGTLSDFERQRRLKVLSLTDNTAYILAWGNDTSYDRIFVEQLKNLAAPGDLLIAISGSGNSPNVLRAIEYAQTHDIKSVGFTGYDGGKLRAMADLCIHVDNHNMGLVEAVHGVVFHYLIEILKPRFAEIGMNS